MLVFVPANASSSLDRDVGSRTSSGSKRSIELLRELGSDAPLLQERAEGVEADRARASTSAGTISPSATVRAGHSQPEVQGGVDICANNVVSMGTQVLEADDDDDGAIVSGTVPSTTPQSHDSQEEAPPPEADAPEASTRVSFAGGVHLHINTQREQVDERRGGGLGALGGGADMTLEWGQVPREQP